MTITDISADRGEESQNKLTSLGYKVQFVHSDVTSWSSLQGAFKSAIEFSPNASLDIIIVNAGITATSILDSAFPTSINEGDDLPEPSTATLDVNLKGAYYTSVLALHYLKKTPKDAEANADRGKKQIVFMGSMAGYGAFPLTTDYVVSKYGVRAIWKSLLFQDDNLGFGLRTNLIAPGYIDTPLLKGRGAGMKETGWPVGSVKNVTDAVIRVLVDDSIDGRAVAVCQGEIWDLRDDPSGGDSASTLGQLKYMEQVAGPHAKAMFRYDDYFKD